MQTLVVYCTVPSLFTVRLLIIISLTSEPDMRKLKKIVIPEVKASWRDLAFSMGYDIPEVKAIESDDRDVEDRCTKLFMDWLETDHGDTPRTWQKLLEKIERVSDLYAAAERIKKKLLEQ